MPPVDWRDTLATLRSQFEAAGAASQGLYHLFVEVADHERDKFYGPTWFAPFDDKKPKVVDGKPVLDTWDCCRFEGLPTIFPTFRPATEEDETSIDESKLVRDGSGKVQAVFVPMRLRQGFLCGPGSLETTQFESLADSAARSLSSAKDLQCHYLASELVDLFRNPRSGVRLIFGDVPSVPDHFIANAWNAGIAQFEHGVLIDCPIAESEPSCPHWLLLLHRLGWRSQPGSGLTAKQVCWGENVEADLQFLRSGLRGMPDDFTKQFENVSSESFYSIVGSKDAPLDVNVASALAINLLLAELSTGKKSATVTESDIPDYSNEEWKKREIPAIKDADIDAAKNSCTPKVGILVATETEKQALLKRMKPPINKRSIMQVFQDKSTYYVGRLGVTDIVACMVAMGSVGRDSSLLVTNELINAWNPSAIIMAGIAFGKDSLKQSIGNALVSERVISYEPQRIGADKKQDRGEQHAAGATLLNRFRNVVGWEFDRPDGQCCGFQCGPLLSGEKLVDDPEFKESLFERFPNAIGGEMEGAGVAAAALRSSCEWILVKSICDWGDGSKDNVHQEFAAASSVSLVEHVLNQPGALDALIEQNKQENELSHD